MTIEIQAVPVSLPPLFSARLVRVLRGDVLCDPLSQAASEVEKLVEVRLVQARLERMVQLPNNSGKQNIAALLERLILDIFDKVSAHKAGVTQTGHPSAVLSAANAALIYGGDHPATHAANAGQVVEVRPGLGIRCLHGSARWDAPSGWDVS